ncbi:MAG: FixH family protein [Thaumarchaeota archaeon]|nr:FixH family protein [Nitrososphaerota archaeon]
MNLIFSMALFAISLSLFSVTFFQNAEAQSMMGTCSDMMNKAPKDVTIRSASSQLVKSGQEATITILVKDKATNKPLLDAQVPIMIERGPSMSTMDMMGSMIQAEEIGQGKYQVKFTPDKKGVYTIHTHVIPDGKSMMAMMNNHMDIGVLAK